MRLIGETQSGNGIEAAGMYDSLEKSAAKHENFVWSRVMSIPQFSISGVFANKLMADLEEAKEEINAAGIEY